ncbi:MAG: transposase, partial [Treponemataceae bacterium]|nr:transposase [Treponemataceae bacterium]
MPTAAAYSRFLKGLMRHQEQVREIFTTLVHTLTEELPDFGQTLAIDGKALESYGNPVEKKKGGKADGRRDTDADWGVKRYSGGDAAGKRWEKTVSWFGYKLHLLVDADYELPVDFRVTTASRAEQPVARELLAALPERYPALVERAKYLCGDRGYDDHKILDAALELGIS